MSDALIRALLTILFGAVAGGLTNTVAIWMLFHPYEPFKLFGLRIGFLHGAIPKNQARLAAAVGKTVGSRLLTDEDLAAIFADEAFRDAFDERLSGFLGALLHEERGSLRELFPEVALAEVEGLLEEMVDFGLLRLDEYLASERFPEAISRRAQEIVESIADEPIAGLLTPAREEAIAELVEDWIQDAVDSEDFQEAVADYLERASDKLLTPGRTFEEILPPGLVGAVEKGIAGYLPLAIQRLGSLLEDEKARARFERFIHELLRNFMKDLKFHQRLVASLIVTEQTIDKVLNTIEAEGAERLSEMLQEEEIQEAMARGVNEAIVDFLRRPVVSVLGEGEDPSVVGARATLAGWILNLASDPATRSFVVEKLGSALERAGARTWGDVFGKLPPEKVSGWLVTAARSEPAGVMYRATALRLSAGLLDQPIGTPANWLPEGAPRRIEESLARPVWKWLQTQVPAVVRQIDVARRVEEKVLEFPTAKMEDLVRRITDRELKLIVWLGYVLGAFIGVALVIMNTFLP